MMVAVLDFQCLGETVSLSIVGLWKGTGGSGVHSSLYRNVDGILGDHLRVWGGTSRYLGRAGDLCVAILLAQCWSMQEGEC